MLGTFLPTLEDGTTSNERFGGLPFGSPGTSGTTIVPSGQSCCISPLVRHQQSTSAPWRGSVGVSSLTVLRMEAFWKQGRLHPRILSSRKSQINCNLIIPAVHGVACWMNWWLGECRASKAANTRPDTRVDYRTTTHLLWISWNIISGYQKSAMYHVLACTIQKHTVAGL